MDVREVPVLYQYALFCVLIYETSYIFDEEYYAGATGFGGQYVWFIKWRWARNNGKAFEKSRERKWSLNF